MPWLSIPRADRQQREPLWVDPLCLAPNQRRVLLLPSSVRDLAAGQGERALCGVGEVLLFGFEVRLAAVRSPAETLAYGSPDLLGEDMRLDVLSKILHVRGHAPPDLEHLPLYALRRLAHRLSRPSPTLDSPERSPERLLSSGEAIMRGTSFSRGALRSTVYPE